MERWILIAGVGLAVVGAVFYLYGVPYEICLPNSCILTGVMVYPYRNLGLETGAIGALVAVIGLLDVGSLTEGKRHSEPA